MSIQQLKENITTVFLRYRKSGSATLEMYRSGRIVTSLRQRDKSWGIGVNFVQCAQWNNFETDSKSQ